jgi:hypothetical protein
MRNACEDGFSAHSFSSLLNSDFDFMGRFSQKIWFLIDRFVQRAVFLGDYVDITEGKFCSSLFRLFQGSVR